MVFADLKNDFVFRRIFATHPLPQGPMRDAMELAKEATFSETEVEAYRKVMDEIQQARDYGETKHAEGVAEGHKSGLVEGQTLGQASAIFTIFAARKVVVTESARQRIVDCKDAALLERWIAQAVTVSSVDELA